MSGAGPGVVPAPFSPGGQGRESRPAVGGGGGFTVPGYSLHEMPTSRMAGAGYHDGLNQYGASFVPQATDPTGLEVERHVELIECGFIRWKFDNSPGTAITKSIISFSLLPDKSQRCECKCGDMKYNTEVLGKNKTGLELRQWAGEGHFWDLKKWGMSWTGRRPRNYDEHQFTIQPLWKQAQARGTTETMKVTGTCPDPDGLQFEFCFQIEYEEWNAGANYGIDYSVGGRPAAAHQQPEFKKVPCP